MRKPLAILFCFLWIETTFADIRPASFENPFFSYAEWKEIYSTRRCPEDLVVLRDGSKLCGVIEKLPAIEYTFGNLDFNVSQIAVVNLSLQETLYKVQYISRDGQNFIGPLSKGKFSIWVNEPSPKNPEFRIKKEIDPAIISFILLKERGTGNKEPDKKYASIELKNGDSIPAIIKNDLILLSDGWKDEELHPEDILEVNFNGGLHGSVLRGGAPIDLGFMFVKDRYLTLQLSKQNQIIRIPWDQVAAIQAKNGGFRQDNIQARPSGILIGKPQVNDLEEALQMGVQTTAPDSIGFTKGILLLQASGAICVAPAVCKKIISLGNEMVADGRSLFPPEHEKEWLLAIASSHELQRGASLKIEDLIPLHEALIFESMPKVDVEPETFNVNPIPEKSEQKETQNEHLQGGLFHSSLTPEAAALIEQLSLDEDLDEFMVFEEEEEELTDEALDTINEILADEDLEEIKPFHSSLELPYPSLLAPCDELDFSQIDDEESSDSDPVDPLWETTGGDQELTPGEWSLLREMGF